MKHSWAFTALLPVVLGSSNQFNVYDDLLAFPQYEILWQEDAPVSKEYAQRRLSSTRLSIHTSSSASDTDLAEPSIAFEDAASLRYELMVRKDQAYLCSLPIAPPESADTSKSSKTAKEEEQELALATKRGWDLLKGMEGSCLYLISGYWSYSFCYNQGVRQFHQLPPGRNVPVYPPVEDKTESAYILGKFDESGKDEPTESGLKLAGSGHSRYLTRKLSGGTKCDLTGDERSIEVQVCLQDDGSH
jgi:protein OS-9